MLHAYVNTIDISSNELYGPHMRHKIIMMIIYHVNSLDACHQEFDFLGKTSIIILQAKKCTPLFLLAILLDSTAQQ